MAVLMRLVITAILLGIALGNKVIIDDIIAALDPDELQESFIELESQEIPLGSDNVPGEYLALLRTTVNSNDAVGPLITRLKDEFTVTTLTQIVVGSMTSLWLRGEEDNVMLAAHSIPEIQLVEQNRRVYASQSVCHTQSTTDLWGLDRIDQVNTVASNVSGTYHHSSGDAGEGVDIYIMDTGIRVDHTEFEGRATWGYTASDITDGDIDGNGHGTHVAGTVGAMTYGVAKKAHLTAVKVLDNSGSGSTAGILESLQWVLADHAQKTQQNNKKPKAVLNLSLGMNGTSITMEDALNAVIAEGLNVVVAAGNSYMDACQYSPARVANAITVGASDYLDTAAYFTNWGTCLDLFAPGVAILSTYSMSTTSLAMASGTSMAAPHVTGAVARYLSTLEDAPTPADVTNWIISQATTGELTLTGTDEMSSPNILLYAECYYGNGNGNGNGNVNRASLLSLLVLLLTFAAVNDY